MINEAPSSRNCRACAAMVSASGAMLRFDVLAAIVVASGLYILYRETMRTGHTPEQVTSMSPDDTV